MATSLRRSVVSRPVCGGQLSVFTILRLLTSRRLLQASAYQARVKSSYLHKKMINAKKNLLGHPSQTDQQALHCIIPKTELLRKILAVEVRIVSLPLFCIKQLSCNSYIGSIFASSCINEIPVSYICLHAKIGKLFKITLFDSIQTAHLPTAESWTSLLNLSINK